MIPNIPNIQNPERFGDFELSRDKLEYALSEAIKKIDIGIRMHKGLFPLEYSNDNVYKTVENHAGWGNGFWTGIIWHAYELTDNEKYKETALGHIPSWTKRIVEQIGVNHHDMGFLFCPSCVAAWKLDGNEEAKQTAIKAAEHLCTRYSEEGKFIQAWGNVGDPTAYRLIIDCLLNIPLLYWAAEVTGNKKFDEIAYNHFKTTVQVVARPDASTYHTYYFDVDTHVPLRGVTHQGANDESAWSRGQAWGMYGPMLTYIYKKDEDAMKLFKATANYFLNHLPEDYVPYWDLCFSDGSGEHKDSSAAAIGVCAMLEAVKHMDHSDPLRSVYINASKRIMNSLIDTYLTKDLPEANGLLLHAVYSVPHNRGVDEMNIWGCYFYMEALHRMLDPEWKLYW